MQWGRPGTVADVSPSPEKRDKSMMLGTTLTSMPQRPKTSLRNPDGTTTAEQRRSERRPLGMAFSKKAAASPPR